MKKELSKLGKALTGKAKTPRALRYRPELDQTDELDAERCNYCQGLSGVPWWMREFGRADILTSVSLLSRVLVSGREGHLKQVFHVFSYLKHRKKSTMAFDYTEHRFHEKVFKACNWEEFYLGAEYEK